jgi:hypothetical protein
MYGTSVRWMKMALSRPTSCRNCRIASRNGSDSDGAPDLGDHDVVTRGGAADGILDLVGDVRDHLHRRAQIFAAPLAVDDRLIDAAGGDVVLLR